MAGQRKQKFNAKHRAGKSMEHRMNRTLDKLAEFEVFDTTILPELKKMVLENWPPERIRKAFAPVMQGLMIQKGLQGNLKAIKDTLDRHEGTAVQRVEQKTVYAHMTKKELAALALQKLLDANIIDTTGRVVRELPGKEDKK
jgi:hypothetical protein